MVDHLTLSISKPGAGTEWYEGPSSLWQATQDFTAFLTTWRPLKIQ